MRDERGRLTGSRPNVQRWPRGLTLEAITRMTPDEARAAKERWLRDYPELAEWFEKLGRT